ncbi:7-carboxy-7-deazaguanine synthase QueE [Desertibacillus haloalkaliphilus]|uniref:7-carboxy-7-deazaguanine synthase QueE n=1 Tax=Desertibacillus haloalkaliphilus TaxID=1328930 RepID=UPI001C256703|nr:radical SAM protein [Desertibacillus haloalkaliphilus]MBU8905242.1 radical SAM protein [Desertibacillus haloalkaliphilus]
MSRWTLPDDNTYLEWSVPMVEIFETVEGEGSMAGFPTVFVRVFHCNLRCTWCDTPYSYAPAKPAFEATIREIVERIKGYASKRICFTGGEPLIHKEKSAALLKAMADIDDIVDIHVETNGAIDLEPFEKMREEYEQLRSKVRFVIDYKLPDSGENERMIHSNFEQLSSKDEIKFVIASDDDFEKTVEVVNTYHNKGQVLVSPVWETMPPAELVKKVLDHQLADVKVSLQLHKVIWDPDARGV